MAQVTPVYELITDLVILVDAKFKILCLLTQSTHKLVHIFLHSPATLIFLSKEMSIKRNIQVGNKIIIIKHVKCCLKTHTPTIIGSCGINLLKVLAGNMQQKSLLLSIIQNTFSCCAQIKHLLPPLPPLTLPSLLLNLIFPIY